MSTLDFTNRKVNQEKVNEKKKPIAKRIFPATNVSERHNFDLIEVDQWLFFMIECECVLLAIITHSNRKRLNY